MQGGADSDTYEFVFGDGRDTIIERNGINDVLELRPNADTPYHVNFRNGMNANVVATRNGSDLVVSMNSDFRQNLDSVTLSNSFSSPNFQVEKLHIYGLETHLIAPGSPTPTDPGYLEINLSQLYGQMSNGQSVRLSGYGSNLNSLNTNNAQLAICQVPDSSDPTFLHTQEIPIFAPPRGAT